MMDLSLGPELVPLEPIVNIHNRPATRQLARLAVYIVLQYQLCLHCVGCMKI